MQIKYHTLTLRPLRKDDAPLIHQTVIENLSHFLLFMDWAHFEQSEENQVKRIALSEANFLNKTELDFLIFDGDDFVGAISLHPPKSRNKNAYEIGYWIKPSHCKKGYATLATQILTVFAVETLHCDRIEIGCNKANLPSKKVIEKCGFTFEGTLRNYFTKPTPKMLQGGYTQERDFLLYSLTSEDIPSLPWYPKIKNKHKHW